MARSLAVLLCCCLCGCHSFMTQVSEDPISPPGPSAESTIPREKSMVSLPRYVVEPPDILNIQSVKMIPFAPHRLGVYDYVSIQAENTASEPISQAFPVNESGEIDLGSSYGKIRVLDLTLEEAQAAVQAHLQQAGGTPEVLIRLLQTPDTEFLFGEYLVERDGTINLGSYGRVYVTGFTLDQIKQAVEQHLKRFFESAEVLVSVQAYNSKTFFVITEGTGHSDSVRRYPITGGQTVLDAIGSVGGISQLTARNKIWIARPSPSGEADQILPVDWVAISQGASTTTNYQIMPKDRLYLARDETIATSAYIGKITQPFENLFGFVGIGTSTLTNIARFGQRSNF